MPDETTILRFSLPPFSCARLLLTWLPIPHTTACNAAHALRVSRFHQKGQIVPFMKNVAELANGEQFVLIYFSALLATPIIVTPWLLVLLWHLGSRFKTCCKPAKRGHLALGCGGVLRARISSLPAVLKRLLNNKPELATGERTAAHNRWIAYNKMRGQYGSAMEHAIPELFWVDRNKCSHLDDRMTRGS